MPAAAAVDGGLEGEGISRGLLVAVTGLGSRRCTKVREAAQRVLVPQKAVECLHWTQTDSGMRCGQVQGLDWFDP